MALILLIETSTKVLSVALARDGKCIASSRSTEERAHAALTAPLIDELLKKEGLCIKDLDAVCVSKGPGSYTGLRVGSSSAKGIAFGADIPLIAIGTLDILAASSKGKANHIVPMIDARRMEVYTAVYDRDGKQLSPVEALIIGPESFSDILSQGTVLFTGDGALKCREVIQSPAAIFEESYPFAENMASLAEQAYTKKQFEDTAYFEPFYLKDFVATVSRKPLL